MTKTPSIEAHLQQWDDVFSSRSWGRYPPEELIRFVFRNFRDVEDRSQTRFLEVGCGPGANIWFLVREGFKVAGIDGSETALKLGLDRLMEEGLIKNPGDVDLRQGNFATLPWKNETFDAVIDIEAVYANQMATIRSCISETHRVLKPNALFFGKMFGDKTTGYKTGNPLADETSLDPTEGALAGFGLCHFFTEEELRELFAPFSALSLDWVHRSENKSTQNSFEWLVTAQK